MRTDHPTLPFAPTGKTVSLSPPVRIAVSVLWIFSIALLPNRLWAWHGLTALSLLTLSLWLRMAWIVLFRRTAVLCPFLAVTAIGLLGQPDWPLRALNLVLKAALSLWVASLLMHVTPFHEFASGLRRLRFPLVWVDLFVFLFRYFGVLSSEWRRMQLARQARTFQRGHAREFTVLAHSLGSLFIRAYERAEQVHHAMLARGYRSTSAQDPA